MYNCRVCDKSYKNKKALHVHETKVHKFHDGTCNKCGAILDEVLKKRAYKHCRKCRAKHADGYWKKRLAETPVEARREVNERRRKDVWNIRLEMIAAYGGKCECCSESSPYFLGIDHIYGNGLQDRREISNNKGKNGIGGGHSFYRYLKKQGWPKDKYRLMCHNCNFSMGHFGFCPHQQQIELFQSRPIKRYTIEELRLFGLQKPPPD